MEASPFRTQQTVMAFSRMMEETWVTCPYCEKMISDLEHKPIQGVMECPHCKGIFNVEGL